MTDEEHKKTPTPALGAGIALGAGLGAVLFSLTDNAVWIGLGAAIGVAIGAVWQERNRN